MVVRRHGGAGRARVAARLSTLVSALTLASCAPRVDPRFTSAMDEARKSERTGDAAAASRAYALAARTAREPRDAAYARKEEARARLRAGDVEGARRVLEALAAARPPNDESTGASYELARLELEHGSRERGLALLDAFVRRSPDHPMARAALTRALEERDGEGPAATLAYLDELEPALARFALAQTAAYARAERLERAGSLAAARDVYLHVAATWPYPKGTLYEDALFRASALEERLGNVPAAITHLDKLLSVREQASLMGSYERHLYAPAQFRKAVLYRDALRDAARAEREFHALYKNFPDSILRDDALWAEALLRFSRGDASGGCELATALVRELPSSRYVACARTRCPHLARTRGQDAGREATCPSRPPGAPRDDD